MNIYNFTVAHLNKLRKYNARKFGSSRKSRHYYDKNSSFKEGKFTIYNMRINVLSNCFTESFNFHLF